MSTTIKLNAAAVSKLIELDENFGVEIQQCVLAEIAKRYIKPGAALDTELHKASKAAEVEILKIYGNLTGYYNSDKKFEFNNTHKEAIRRSIREAIEQEINTIVKKACDSEMEFRMKYVANNIKSKVSEYIDAEVKRQVKEKVDNALRGLAG